MYGAKEPTYKQWASLNLRVGPYPNPTDLDPNGELSEYVIFINVSDEQRDDICLQLALTDKAYRWFPMGEMRGTMTLTSIYGALVTLYRCEEHNVKVYLHCSAGINRSQTVADCYHYLREEGMSHREKHTVRAKVRGMSLNALQTNCHFGVLPPLPEMEAWLLRVGEQLGDANGGGFDYSKPPVFV